MIARRFEHGTSKYSSGRRNKTNAEATLAALGLTIPVIVNMLLKQMIRTGSVPFEITTGKSQLLKRMADADAGRNMHYHDLVEVEDDEEAVE